MTKKKQAHRLALLLACFLFTGTLSTLATPASPGSYKLAIDSEVGELLSNLPENSWVQLNTNEFQDVWTPLALRPKPPLAASVGSPHSIINAWSSMAWDSNRGNLIFWGGGHANYPGNDVYTWQTANLQWGRASLPSEVTLVNEAAGQYEAVDGVYNAPTSAHTYDNSEFLPQVDRFVTFGGANFNTGRHFVHTDGARTGPYFWDPAKADGSAVGGSTGSHVSPDLFTDILGGIMWQNRDNLAPQYSGDPKPGLGLGFVNGTSAYTTEDGKDSLYLQSSSRLFKYVVHDINDPAADTYEQVGRYFYHPFSGQGAGAYDPERKIFLRTANSTFTFWKMDNPSATNENEIFHPVVEGPAFDRSYLKYYGMDYDPLRGRFLLWDGNPEVWSLTAPDDLVAGDWTLGAVAISTGDAPDISGHRSILGKWKYAAALDVFFGVFDPYKGDIWAFKPSNWHPEVVEPLPYLVTPRQSSLYSTGDDIVVTADSVDETVTRVRVYANDILIGESFALPYQFTWFAPEENEYTLTAVSVSDGDVSRTSPSIQVTVGAATNISPSVALTAPADGTAFTLGDDVALSATASDSDGSVVRVEFYQGATLVGEDATAPYSYTWASPAEGSYTLTAVAIDDDGASTTSSSRAIDVTNPANLAPTVYLTAPTDGATFTAGNDIPLAATASDGDGSVVQVEFYSGGTLLGIDTSAPYNLIWNSAPEGIYALTAVAVDDDDASTTSSSAVINVIADPGNIAPEVELTGPLSGTEYTVGDDIELTATASDADGSIARVEFYQGSILLGEDTSAPYSYTWAPAPAGTHSLTAVAFDNTGEGTRSSVALVTVVAVSGAAEVTLQQGLDGYTGTTDAHMYDYHSSSNYGSRTYLYDQNSKFKHRSLLRFAVFQSEGGPVPDGATIISATLSVYKYSYYNHTYQWVPLLIDWRESEVNWERPQIGEVWSSPSGTGVGSDIADAADGEGSVGWSPGWLDIDITGGIRAIAAGRPNFGWSLAPAGGNSNIKRYRSSESSYTDQRPKLLINYSN